MKTPLEKISLDELLNRPILFDANIFMIGVDKRISDTDYSFERMKSMYIVPLLESFTNIYIHEFVYYELDEASKALIDKYVEKNVTIVGEDDLYGKDPLYTTIFNNIKNHELVNYTRGQSKDRGEVFSLAYAAYHGMNYFSSREIMVDLVADELIELADVEIVTFDVILLVAYQYHAKREDGSYRKGLKAVYKSYCADVIKRHGLPNTFSEYIVASMQYIVGKDESGYTKDDSLHN